MLVFNVGDRAFFHYSFDKDHNPIGFKQLYAGTIKGIGPERVVLERDGDGKLCSVDWRENLLAIDGMDYSGSPEPKPPTHHEIIEARWYGLWIGVFWGSLVVGAAWIATSMFISLR